MVLGGDLTTMALPDLLQWLEQTNQTGLLILERPSGKTAVWVRARDVVGISTPSGITAPVRPVGPDKAGLALAQVTAGDRLLDLFLEAGGTFQFVPGETPENALVVRLSLRVLVMEGLRLLDEWPRLKDAYPLDTARLSRSDVLVQGKPSALHHAILMASSARPSLADVRLKLALSRPALLRHVDELRTQGLVDVEGAATGGDPIARLVFQASQLAKAGQFEEAGIVFQSLLAADPTDGRVRRLLLEVEAEQVAALYNQFSPLSLVTLEDPAALRGKRLSASDRALAERITNRWDVSTLVLASPLREVETLRSLARLVKAGVVAVTLPGA